MKYIEKFKFRLDDMDHNGELKNEAILKMLENDSLLDLSRFRNAR